MIDIQFDVPVLVRTFSDNVPWIRTGLVMFEQIGDILKNWGILAAEPEFSKNGDVLLYLDIEPEQAPLAQMIFDSIP